MNPIWIAFGVGILAGFSLGLLSIDLLNMAARSERDQEYLESTLQPPSGTGFQPVDLIPGVPLTMGQGFTYCPNCQASFKNEVCPGCSPDID